MFVRSLRALGSVFTLSAAATLAAACSSSTSSPLANAPVDAGAPAPQTPEDVPPVRWEADPATECPAPYDTQKPKSSTTVVNRSFKVAGQSREFILILPPDSFTGPRPVFVGFNGTGETGPSFTDRASLEDFAKKGFIVLAPSSAGNGTVWPVWDGMRIEGTEDAPNKDLAYFDALLKCTAGHFEVDKNRIYIGGHSAGGIFTNYVAQRRSDILAGAIPASGIFSSTSPSPMPDLAKMLVLVTWGGENDKYTGSASGVTVPEANFVSEASVATKAYAAQRNVGQANCRGNKMGHVWLPINDWFIERLLEHPKGLPGADGVELPPVPSSKVTCTTDVFEFKGAQVSCGSSTTNGCREACQLFADCAVANGTVSSAMKAELGEIGFAGTDCRGCVKTCESKSDGEEDATVLDCMKKAQATAKCAQGIIPGAKPLIDAVNSCCDGKLGSSKYCGTVCTAIAKNGLASTYFTSCAK